MIDPKDIILMYDGGTGNMGTVTDETDTAARFRRPGERWAVSSVRVHFSGGSGTLPTLSMKVDSFQGTFNDVLMFSWTLTGTGADATLLVPPDQIKDFILDVGDELVFEWANPDTGNMVWGITVGVATIG